MKWRAIKQGIPVLKLTRVAFHTISNYEFHTNSLFRLKTFQDQKQAIVRPQHELTACEVSSMSLINIHNGDYDARSLFACKGFPSSKHLDLSVLGFAKLKAEVNLITRPLPFSE